MNLISNHKIYAYIQVIFYTQHHIYNTHTTLEQMHNYKNKYLIIKKKQISVLINYKIHMKNYYLTRIHPIKIKINVMKQMKYLNFISNLMVRIYLNLWNIAIILLITIIMSRNILVNDILKYEY